jgi:uncharacterized protein (DUF362 family)/Pyruvate/2-oxoacid:ferredoxin oxidoreductase delta subunit
MKVVVRDSSYAYEQFQPIFFEMMDVIGGEAIRKGQTVLIKPNMLIPATPQQAILTHPSVIRAAVAYVLSKGARPVVADSPAMGSFERILKENGIAEALMDLDVRCHPFQDTIKVDVGKPFDLIEMAADAVHADAIINLPKLKTHNQMLLTLGVKNMFGCIVGNRKAEWHLRTGINEEMFARLLVLICQRIKPAFTVLDGILALEGEGPGKRGVPREIGVLIGSGDCFAVDTAVCRMLGLVPEQLPTLRVAARMGLIGEALSIDGTLPAIKDFRLPAVASSMFGPRLSHGLLRRHLLRRPVVDSPLCRLCGKCAEICPANAVTSGGDALLFNYDRCIRCYCCIEICPHGALHTEETLPGRVLRRIFLPKS